MSSAPTRCPALGGCRSDQTKPNQTKDDTTRSTEKKDMDTNRKVRMRVGGTGGKRGVRMEQRCQFSALFPGPIPHMILVHRTGVVPPFRCSRHDSFTGTKQTRTHHTSTCSTQKHPHVMVPCACTVERDTTLKNSSSHGDRNQVSARVIRDYQLFCSFSPV